MVVACGGEIRETEREDRRERSKRRERKSVKVDGETRTAADRRRWRRHGVGSDLTVGSITRWSASMSGGPCHYPVGFYSGVPVRVSARWSSVLFDRFPEAGESAGAVKSTRLNRVNSAQVRVNSVRVWSNQSDSQRMGSVQVLVRSTGQQLSQTARFGLTRSNRVNSVVGSAVQVSSLVQASQSGQIMKHFGSTRSNRVNSVKTGQLSPPTRSFGKEFSVAIYIYIAFIYFMKTSSNRTIKV
ncbi:hypothetical protein HanHA300_Chr17g0651661 [Helianthus annuus]|nr:hypothetical protein HanHA300_Chr17g0651661 [Helianthus annuus]KAJ0632193.1 hypothetical protein HanLR1_Chr17g0662321 [Helianthus annuus]